MVHTHPGQSVSVMVRENGTKCIFNRLCLFGVRVKLRLTHSGGDAESQTGGWKYGFLDAFVQSGPGRPRGRSALDPPSRPEGGDHVSPIMPRSRRTTCRVRQSRRVTQDWSAGVEHTAGPSHNAAKLD